MTRMPPFAPASVITSDSGSAGPATAARLSRDWPRPPRSQAQFRRVVSDPTPVADGRVGRVIRGPTTAGWVRLRWKDGSQSAQINQRFLTQTELTASSTPRGRIRTRDERSPPSFTTCEGTPRSKLIGGLCEYSEVWVWASLFMARSWCASCGRLQLLDSKFSSSTKSFDVADNFHS
jgi:hypothetical protein